MMEVTSLISSCEDFSSVWSDLLVNSVKIEDDGDATDFENVDDFETLFNFNDNNPKLSANEPSSVNDFCSLATQELWPVNNLLGMVQY